MERDKFILPGIGPKTKDKLDKLGIYTPSDLLNHFPSRYIDFSHITSISDAPINENCTISGIILQFNNIYSRYGKNIQKATLKDNTGTIDLIWFNQPFLNKTIIVGTKQLFAGTITLYKNKKTLIAPIHGQFNTGKIIAIYPETAGLTSNWFRKTIQQNISSLISSVKEVIPQNILDKYNIYPLPHALKEIHCPSDKESLEKARLSLSLREIIAIQATNYVQKKEWLQSKPRFLIKPYPKVDIFAKSLPFDLTSAQVRVWHEIQADLFSPTVVMNRLLQGDVGSGKTIIALLAALTVHYNHHQTILIAPTQILAKQHWQTFHQYHQRHA